MGLLAAFMAVAGLLGGLALLVMWAGFLERWLDEPVAPADTLDSLLAAEEPVAIEPSASEADPQPEADRFVFPPAA